MFLIKIKLINKRFMYSELQKKNTKMVIIHIKNNECANA